MRPGQKFLLQVREMNLYKEGDLTFYNRVLTNCTLRDLWAQCMQQSDYTKRRKEVDNFNR